VKILASQIERKRKALFIKGFHNAEKLVKIAKSEASKIGMRGKIIVMDIGQYNPALNGQAVIIEEVGCEYNAPGGGSRVKQDSEN